MMAAGMAILAQERLMHRFHRLLPLRQINNDGDLNLARRNHFDVHAFASHTPRTTISSILVVSSFTIVPGLSFKLERTSKTTPNFFANSTDRDCITLAPRLASSSISS